MAINKFDTFLRPDCIDAIVDEISSAFNSVDVSKFTSDPLEPSVGYNKDDNAYHFWGYMVDDTASRFSSKNFGRLAYSGKGPSLHLLTKQPVDDSDTNYKLTEMIGEFEINQVMQSIVDKYKL